MNSKLITALAVAMLAFAGVGVIADDGVTDADDAKYLTIIYDGIIDPADLATIGATPASANYIADKIAEPETYAEGKQFDLIAPFLVGEKFVVPVATAAGWTAAEKTNNLAAFGAFAGPIATEVKFVASANKTVEIANVADIEAGVEEAIALITAMYDIAIADLEADIADLEAQIADKDAKIADLEALLEEALKVDETKWQYISIILGALLIVSLIFGGRAIVLIKKSGGKLF